MESNNKKEAESPSSLNSIGQVKTGGILTLPSVGLAECYALCRILEEKLTSEANAYTSPLGAAIAGCASAVAKIRMAVEAMGEVEDEKAVGWEDGDE